MTFIIVNFAASKTDYSLLNYENKWHANFALLSYFHQSMIKLRILICPKVCIKILDSRKVTSTSI